MGSLETFFESPANRTGVAIWVATAITVFVQYFLLHQSPSSADLLGLVLGLVKIIQPENCVTIGQLGKAIADVSTALTAPTPAAIRAAIGDVESIAAGVTKTTTN